MEASHRLGGPFRIFPRDLNTCRQINIVSKAKRTAHIHFLVQLLAKCASLNVHLFHFRPTRTIHWKLFPFYFIFSLLLSSCAALRALMAPLSAERSSVLDILPPFSRLLIDKCAVALCSTRTIASSDRIGRSSVHLTKAFRMKQIDVNLPIVTAHIIIRRES